MIKVGIVTVYTNINYGSKLQSYALQKVLKMIGVDKAENLLVDKDIAHDSWCVIIKRIIKNSLKTVLASFGYKGTIIGASILRDKFVDFRKHYISESKYTPSQITLRRKRGIVDYDYYICGSDQIWAPNQFHEEYFLGFIDEPSIKISYATSIGLPLIPDSLKEKYKNLIEGIAHVSMREKEGALLVEQVTEGRKVPVVLDPTLLLPPPLWSDIKKDYVVNQRYILCLFLGENETYREWVETLKQKTGFTILTLPLRTWDYQYGDKQCFDVGPQEFLSLVEKAEYICTDSFHGMAFSVNYNKPFFVFLRFKEDDSICQNSRIFNLIDSLNLRNRLVDDFSRDIDYYISQSIDWKYVNGKLYEMREFSLNYLKSALGLR